MKKRIIFIVLATISFSLGVLVYTHTIPAYRDCKEKCELLTKAETVSITVVKIISERKWTTETTVPMKIGNVTTFSNVTHHHEKSVIRLSDGETKTFSHVGFKVGQTLMKSPDYRPTRIKKKGEKAVYVPEKRGYNYHW